MLIYKPWQPRYVIIIVVSCRFMLYLASSRPLQWCTGNSIREITISGNGNGKVKLEHAIDSSDPVCY